MKNELTRCEAVSHNNLTNERLRKAAQNLSDDMSVLSLFLSFTTFEDIEAGSGWVYKNLSAQAFQNGSIKLQMLDSGVTGLGGDGRLVYQEQGSSELSSESIMYAKISAALGFKCGNSLLINGHADQDTSKAFYEALQSNISGLGAASTKYFFTQEGDFGKVSHIPNTISVPEVRNPIYRTDVYSAYVSNMDPSEFEFVGGALKILLTRLGQYLSD